MKLITVVALLITAFIATGEAASLLHRLFRRSATSPYLSWRSCSTVEEPAFQVESLSLSPLPILIPGNITLSMRASSLREIQNMDMDVSVWKKTWLVDIKLPCLFGHGSCMHRDLCQLVQDQDDEMVQLAAQMLEAGGIPMTCPMQPNTLTLDNYEVPLPELPDFGLLLSAIAGEYKVKIELLEHDTAEQLACYEVEVKVEEAPEPEEEEDDCRWFFC